MATGEIVALTPDDADSIVDLERRSFISSLQASKETVLKRFELGHRMLGAREGDRLVGLIGFSYGNFSPDDFGSFPKTLKELCLQQVPSTFNSVFAYNLEVEPSRRAQGYVRQLVNLGTLQSFEAGCKYAVSNCRLPSYAGSVAGATQEHVRAKPDVRQVFDSFLESGVFPSQADFLLDPVLALYHRLTGCTFLWILPGFANDDVASGGMRVIAYAELEDVVNGKIKTTAP